MKHDADLDVLTPQAVVTAVQAAGVRLTTVQAEAMVAHAALVVEANQSINLTRLTAPADMLSLHIVDSLAFLPHVSPLEGRVIDLGSGAGYPGIPLAILGMDVTLCESVKKKAAFLERTCAALGLHTPVEAFRAEELALRQIGEASVVIARAVSAAASLLELAAPLLRHGGRLVALKGTPSEEELRQADRAAEQCGMGARDNSVYVLPTGEKRTVLVFEKTGRPRIVLPRHSGTAQRHPLG